MSKQIKYLNMRTMYGVETVTMLREADCKNYKDFRQQLRQLVADYRMNGMNVYTSQRCTKDWKTS
jgi:hypothetical protein